LDHFLNFLSTNFLGGATASTGFAGTAAGAGGAGAAGAAGLAAGLPLARSPKRDICFSVIFLIIYFKQ
jgi:hypothetical protein